MVLADEAEAIYRQCLEIYAGDKADNVNCGMCKHAANKKRCSECCMFGRTC